MIHSTVFYMVFVLRDFIITKILSFSNLFNLEKFSAFISSFSAFFASSSSLFYRYCLFSAFFALVFVGEGERSPPVPPVIYHLVLIKFRYIMQ